MKARQYYLVSGTVFALVALTHLLRIVTGWDLVIGDWMAPVWASGLGVLIPGFLATTAFRLARRE